MNSSRTRSTRATAGSTRYIHPDDQSGVLAAVQRSDPHKSTFELDTVSSRVRRHARLDVLTRGAGPQRPGARSSSGWGSAGMSPRRNQAGRRGAGTHQASRRSSSAASTRTILSSTPDLVVRLRARPPFQLCESRAADDVGKTWRRSIGKTCLELGVRALARRDARPRDRSGRSRRSSRSAARCRSPGLRAPHLRLHFRARLR